MLQYKIPQNVQIEDKIVGPLTLKQLIIIALGGGISYSIFLFVSKSYVLGIIDYFFIAIPLLISVAFAFIRINDVSFLKWLLLLYEFGHNSRRRKWDKSETARLHFAFVTAKTGVSAAKKKKEAEKNQKQKQNTQVPGKKKFSSLEQLTQVLDHQNPFLEEQKSLSEEHDDDNVLHLTAEEKQRHEERLQKSVEANPNGVSQEKQTSEQQNVSQKSSNGAKQKEVSFENLQQGGSVSFS